MTPERLNELAMVLEHKAHVGNMNGFPKEKLGSVLANAAQALREYATIRPLWDALQSDLVEEFVNQSNSTNFVYGEHCAVPHRPKPGGIVQIDGERFKTLSETIKEVLTT